MNQHFRGMGPIAYLADLTLEYGVIMVARRSLDS